MVNRPTSPPLRSRSCVGLRHQFSADQHAVPLAPALGAFDARNQARAVTALARNWDFFIHWARPKWRGEAEERVPSGTTMPLFPNGTRPPLFSGNPGGLFESRQGHFRRMDVEGGWGHSPGCGINAWA
jgi:hypothetical protein